MLPTIEPLQPNDSDPISIHFTRARLLGRSLYTSMDKATTDPFQRVVMDRMTQDNPSFQPGSKYYERALRLILSSEHGYDDFFDLGVDIGQDILVSSKNDRDKILGFVNSYVAMFQLEAVADKLYGSRAGLIRADLANFTALTILETMPDAEKNQLLLEAIYLAIYEQKSPRSSQNIPSNIFLTVCKESLQKLIVENEVAFNTIKSMENYFGDDSEVLDDETNRLAGLLSAEAMKNRKYGTKPAYIEASIGGVWLFYDGEYYKEKLHMKARPSVQDIAAVVFHVQDESPTDLRISPGGIENQTIGSLSLGEQSIGGAAADADMNIFIMRDGTISTDHEGLNDLSIALNNNPNAAKRLKAELASNFYDLSMPIYKDSPQLKNFATMSKDEKLNFNSIEQLLIPRIKFLNQPPRLVTDTIRTLRQHNVTWFVRLLPQGFRATPDAVSQAAQYGIKLEDNETFVKQHQRGWVNEKVLGYQAIRR
jgi:hypothetical protein